MYDISKYRRIRTHGLLICAIQETHIADSDITSIFNKSDNSIYNVHTISCENRRHGIGFVIKEDTNCAIEKVSDRIAVAKVAYKSQGNIKLLRFINVYAPPRSRSKTYKTVTEKIYKDLENILNTGSVYQTFICGDFNINVGQQHKNYPDNIGPFNKGKATSDSDHLLGLLLRHNLYVTNRIVIF